MVVTFTRCHLLEESVDLRGPVLDCRQVRRALATQRQDGSWHVPGGKHEDRHSTMLTSLKSFRMLVHRYELDRSMSEVEKAAEHMFSYQTTEGDLRNMLGGQYATHHTGEMNYLLVRAGYWDDARIGDGPIWLLGMGQDDGGCTIPILTYDLSGQQRIRPTSGHMEPLPPVRDRPSSHNWTDMVLRAFAAHQFYRHDREAGCGPA